MRREWEFFDERTVRDEFDALPARDAAKLASLMEHYRQIGFADPSPVQIDDYGNGIYRLRHFKPQYQGRAIFFVSERLSGFERLVVLSVYKKEGQGVPKNILDRVLARKRSYEEKRKSNG